MTHRTAEQTQSENIQVMGEELGETYSALWQELARLHQKWLQYVTLFGTSPKRIELLNEVAPRITYAIQKALWLDIVLHIARLADSAETGKGAAMKKNLSLERLKNILKNSSEAEEIQYHMNIVKDSSAFARDWRHRSYAHRDLEIATGKNCEPLKTASRVKVKAALTTMAEFMNLVARTHGLPITVFDVDGSGAGADVERFLRTLRNGVDYEKQLIAKVKAGELTWKDVHKPM